MTMTVEMWNGANVMEYASEIEFVPYGTEHREAVTGIYNGYVLAGTAAFPQDPVTHEYFDALLELPDVYPFYVLLDTKNKRVAGFCFLTPYHALSTFRHTAVIGYFIAPEYTGKKLGTLCLQRLEAEAKKAGISHIIADISSENYGSIAFHTKHGFRHFGVLENIGSKLGRNFSMVYIQKNL